MRPSRAKKRPLPYELRVETDRPLPQPTAGQIGEAVVAIHDLRWAAAGGVSSDGRTGDQSEGRRPPDASPHVSPISYCGLAGCGSWASGITDIQSKLPRDTGRRPWPANPYLSSSWEEVTGDRPTCPPGGRSKHPLAGIKGIDVKIGGRALIEVVIERIRQTDAFDPIYVAGPGHAYRSLPDGIPVDTDGGFGRNIQVGVETARSRHGDGPLAVTTCDIVPEPDELRTVVEDYWGHGPLDFFFPMIRAPRNPERPRGVQVEAAVPRQAGGRQRTGSRPAGPPGDVRLRGVALEVRLPPDGPRLPHPQPAPSSTATPTWHGASCGSCWSRTSSTCSICGCPPSPGTPCFPVPVPPGASRNA